MLWAWFIGKTIMYSVSRVLLRDCGVVCPQPATTGVFKLFRRCGCISIAFVELGEARPSCTTIFIVLLVASHHDHCSSVFVPCAFEMHECDKYHWVKLDRRHYNAKSVGNGQLLLEQNVRCVWRWLASLQWASQLWRTTWRAWSFSCPIQQLLSTKTLQPRRFDYLLDYVHETSLLPYPWVAFGFWVECCVWTLILISGMYVLFSCACYVYACKYVRALQPPLNCERLYVCKICIAQIMGVSCP